MFDFWRFKTISLEAYQVIEGNYDFFLVALSFLISCFAAYALLVVLERAWQTHTAKSLFLWKIFGSVVFGLGVWAMHFTGMMAFMLPISMSYNMGLTVLSVFTPMVGVYLALGRLSEENFSFKSIQVCSVYLALAIGSMHYIGMEAMEVDAIMRYDPIWFFSSLGTAFVLAMMAIYMIKLFNSVVRHMLVAKISSALLMGSAVACMHYTAMAAVSYHIDTMELFKPHSMSDHVVAFSLVITGIVFFIVATTILCALVEDKLQKAEITIEESARREKDILEHMADGLLTMDPSGVIESVNSAAISMFGYTKNELIGKNIEVLMDSDKVKHLNVTPLDITLLNDLGKTFVTEGIHKESGHFPIEINVSKISATSQHNSVFNCVVRNITKRVQLENQLRQAQKLESIGQLSAGIAHEINTPTQYVSDNTMFLNAAFDSCLKIINGTKALIDKDLSDITEQELSVIRKVYEDNDMEFVAAEIPLAITQSIDGLDRVKNIIGAMKSFSHSNQGEVSLVDIEEAISSTITVSRSEWRYVAKLSADYAENLPQIKCLRDEFNQVILNFIVNAAHAIEGKYGKESEALGSITIAVTAVDEHIQIIIGDDGTGMPENVKNRIFDPFFTTKDVGKGTGQGLSMAYSVIVEKHKGTIAVESEVNVGTQFIITIPIS